MGDPSYYCYHVEIRARIRRLLEEDPRLEGFGEWIAAAAIEWR